MGFCELHPSHNGREGKVICDWLDEWNDTVVVVVLVRHATDRPSRAYVELVRGEPDHYSLHAYNPSVALRGGFRDESVPHTDRRGRMIHNHPKGPAIPNGQPCGGNDCTPCKKAHFPKPPSQFTTIGPDGFVLYRRGPADIMVVAWNAWVALYLESHVNIEVIVSGGNVVQYLFKLFTYIWKGAGVGDVNKAQLQHEWDCDDEVGHYFRVLETCDTEAFRRMAQMATVIFFPRIEKLIVHAPRARSNNPNERDDGLSDLEYYFARPPLAELDAVLYEPFHMRWSAARKLEDAPKRALPPLPSDPPCLAHYAADGRPVYRGADPTALRGGGGGGGVRAIEACYYWTRIAAPREQVVKRWRIKHVSAKKGDVFYLRKLLVQFPARSFEALLTSPRTGARVTAQERCREEGLLDDELEAREVMDEALEGGESGALLRSLFLQLAQQDYAMEAIYADPSVRAAMAADLDGDEDRLVLALDELFRCANRGDGDALRRRLPSLQQQTAGAGGAAAAAARDEVATERARYDRTEQRALADSGPLALDGRGGALEQTRVVLWMLTGRHSADGAAAGVVLADVAFVRPRGVEILIAYGDAGVGKSRIARRAFAELRARGRLARATAFTWCAASNFEHGTTLHALGCIAVEHEHGVIEKIALVPIGLMTHERLALLKALDAVVYDEGFSGKRNVPEAFVIHRWRPQKVHTQSGRLFY